MQVSKWGNSLAVRLPAGLVKRLGLKEGDEIEFVLRTGDDVKRRVEIEKQASDEELLARLMRINAKIPEGYKFDREEAHEREKPVS